MYSLGSRLREARIRRNLTQKMLADRVNKSVSAISSYESNAQLPPLDVLESIALTLNTSIDFLVGLDSNHTYSAQNLTGEQKELLDLLFKEFAVSSHGCTTPSELQIQIIQKLFNLFF